MLIYNYDGTKESLISLINDNSNTELITVVNKILAEFSSLSIYSDIYYKDIRIINTSIGKVKVYEIKEISVLTRIFYNIFVFSIILLLILWVYSLVYGINLYISSNEIYYENNI